MKKTLLAIAISIISVVASAAPKQYTLTSPDGTVAVNVNIAGTIQYSVSVDGNEILAPSPLSMTLTDGTAYNGQAKFKKAVKSSVNSTIKAQAYRKAEVKENYNQIELVYQTFKVVFRAYNEGVAYRFISLSKKDFNVKSEEVEYNFPGNWNAYIPYVCQNDKGELDEQLHNSFENRYKYQPIAQWDTKHLAFLPLMVEAENGVKMNITEADLLDYPGMFLYNGDCNNSLSGYFPELPTAWNSGRDGRSLFSEATEDYIAQCKAGCTFPWRLIGISRNDWEMLDNDLVYLLASPADPSIDYSWVKPGKVAWDWWNDWNIYGVDFESGVNNDTYKYYIDFASKYGIEYVIMDEGWCDGFEDLFHIVPEIDLEEIIAYGKEKNVGIILWAGYAPFQKDIEKACKVYSEMGVKGFKVDFMDACDQKVVAFLRQSAGIAAKYNLMMDYHGIYKPTGLSRTYPNVINYEGIYGLENLKWNNDDGQVPYDVTVPYIRFFAGSADYTQGAMKNASRSNYRAIYSEPMSQGTRCHQLAEYVIFSSPLNMLCDNPSNYMNEPECTKYIADIPEVWDETRAIGGKVGEYCVVARRSGATWYVGVLGNWDERDLEVKLDFIPDGPHSVTIFKDGVNANKAGRDYKKVTETLSADKTLKVHLAEGGGYVAIIK